MSGTRRRVVTGVATAGVVLTAGAAVAASLSSAQAGATAADPTVAELQDRLAQLQSDTAQLTGEVTAATTALHRAEVDRAARLDAVTKAARAAAAVHVTSAGPRATTAARPRAVAPATHTSTGASGAAGSSSGEHETAGGTDD